MLKNYLQKSPAYSSKSPAYCEVRDWLEGYIPETYSRKELGLRRIENFLKKLGNPEKKFKSIHVGGTSGKGSTAFYIARLLAYSGPVSINALSLARPLSRGQRSYISLHKTGVSKNPETAPSRATSPRNLKIGLHISPHLVYIGERMQIFERQKAKGKRQKYLGNAIPVKRLVSLVNQIKPVVEAIKSKQPYLTPSYFEILVALSFLYFAKEKVDYAVVEVGLGGRLDATNVLSPKISVITNIGLDHTEILGDTIEQIAGEKAGIIKKRLVSRDQRPEGIPVVTGARGKALKVIEKAAKTKDARLINIYTQDIENLRNTDVLRYITKPNDIHRYVPYYINAECALLAITAVLELFRSGKELESKRVKVSNSLTMENIIQAFSVQFAGRFEEIDQGVILDGAHNPDKVRSLVEFIRKYQVSSIKYQVILVLAFKKGKNWRGMIDLLLKNLPITKVVATEYQSVTDTGLGSAVDAEKIAKYVSSIKYQVTSIKTIKNSQEAVINALRLRSGSSTLVLITGSLYLVGEARTLWKLPSFA